MSGRSSCKCSQRMRSRGTCREHGGGSLGAWTDPPLRGLGEVAVPPGGWIGICWDWAHDPGVWLKP